MSMEPDNIEAMHNLCVVFVERGYLLEAEKCLAHVHSLAPNEDYILKHLNIVRSKIQEYYEKKKAAEEAKAAEASEGQGQKVENESEGQKVQGHGQGES